MKTEDGFEKRTLSDIMEEYGEQRDEWRSLDYPEVHRFSLPIPNEPLMIIHGTADDVIPYAAVKRLSELCDNICLITVEGADHRFKRPEDLPTILRHALPWLLNT